MTEHTITEEITGIDIVAAQIQIAAGATLEQLGLTQDRITTRGFCIQTRITTYAKFAPTVMYTCKADVAP